MKPTKLCDGCRAPYLGVQLLSVGLRLGERGHRQRRHAAAAPSGTRGRRCKGCYARDGSTRRVSGSLRSRRCAGWGSEPASTLSSRRGAADGKRGPAAPLQRSAAEQTAQWGCNAAVRVSAAVPGASWLLRCDGSPGWQRCRLATRPARAAAACRWRRPDASLIWPAAGAQALRR